MRQVIKVLKQPIIRVYNWTNVHHLDFYTFPPIHQPLESRHFLSGSEERTTAAGESSHRVQTHVSLKRSVILNVPETRNTSAVLKRCQQLRGEINNRNLIKKE